VPRLFVSHADADTPVVKLVVELLVNGVGVAPDSIFCTALDQGGSKAGEEFIKTVLERLREPDLVVLALISRNFNDSPFCGHEIGATWFAPRKLLAYVIPPSDHKILSGVLFDRQTPSLRKRATLEELKDRVAALLALPPARSDIWNQAVNRFLKGLGPAAFEIERKRAGIEHDVFVSTPMSTVSAADYKQIRKMALRLVNTLEAAAKDALPCFSAYYAATKYASKREFDAKAVAVQQDLDALRASQHYILILDCEIKTSAVFEAGMALAYSQADDSYLQRRSSYFVKSGVKLPFMMQEVHTKYPVQIFEYKNEDQLFSWVVRDLEKKLGNEKRFGITRWESWRIDKEPA
jgi:hypothetical protein